MSDLACPSCGATGGDVAGVEVRGVYDGTLFWSCVKCGNRWQRFPEGDWRHDRTASIWATWDAAES